VILHKDCSCRFVVRFSCQIFSNAMEVVNTSARQHTSAMGAKSATAIITGTTCRKRMFKDEANPQQLSTSIGWASKEGNNGKLPGIINTAQCTVRLSHKTVRTSYLRGVDAGRGCHTATARLFAASRALSRRSRHTRAAPKTYVGTQTFWLVTKKSRGVQQVR